MKIRPAAGLGATLDESMEHVVEIPDRDALMVYLKAHYDFWNPTEQNVTISHYAFDARIGWDTYLICVDRKAALFTDGPMPGVKERVE